MIEGTTALITRNPWQVLRAVRERWPRPISATVYAMAAINREPRLFVQGRAFLLRTARLVQRRGKAPIEARDSWLIEDALFDEGGRVALVDAIGFGVLEEDRSHGDDRLLADGDAGSDAGGAVVEGMGWDLGSATGARWRGANGVWDWMWDVAMFLPSALV